MAQSGSSAVATIAQVVKSGTTLASVPAFHQRIKSLELEAEKLQIAAFERLVVPATSAGGDNTASHNCTIVACHFAGAPLDAATEEWVTRMAMTMRVANG